MKNSTIKIGNRYEIQLGKNTTQVTVASLENGTWLCETDGGKILKVKEAARFLKEVKPPKEKRQPREVAAPKVAKPKDAPSTKRMGPKPNGKMSVLDAAHKVLLEEGRPMKVLEIMETALARKYCVIGGKTPFNTVNGGIRTEITKKGENSRFVWVDKGTFAAR